MPRQSPPKSPDQLQLMEQRFAQHVDKGLEQLESRLGNRISDLTASVDRYLKRTETWHDELRVLQARYDRLVHLLDQKGIVQEEETHLA